MDFPLTTGQQAAADGVIGFLCDPAQTEIIIEGPAGTGKSTLVEHLINSFGKQQQFINLVMGKPKNASLEVIVTATTHKAAQVVSELSNQEPRTIQSLLGLTVRQNFQTGKEYLTSGKNYEKIYDKIILIDEASFIDHDLLKWIRETCLNCKIIYIGDPYQLAPIGLLVPPVFDGSIPAYRLTEVKRNEGPIQQLAKGYRDAVETLQFPELWADGKDILHVNGSTFQQLVDQHFKKDHGNMGNSARLLAWTNPKIHEYNNYVRELNDLPGILTEGEVLLTNKPIITKSVYFQTDRPVEVTRVLGPAKEMGIHGYRLQLERAIEVFVPNSQQEVRRLSKQLAADKDWHTYYEIKNTWADLRPLAACTVHKSQGSTYEKVFIDLYDIGMSTVASDVARLLYVAISRASKQVVLYGNLPPHYGGKTYAA